MKIPPRPPVGHLIAYEYLWTAQVRARVDGVKTRPVAIVVARDDLGPATLAYVVPVSHRAPSDRERALVMPAKLKRHLGLDEQPSWVYTDELNVFAWPGPDIRPARFLSSKPAAAEGCVIGALPTDWFEILKTHLADSYSLGTTRLARRDE